MRKDPLTGKKIIFGVTGCIAAYKSALLVRDLIKRGAEVKVVMTPAATQFITPLTLSSLSNNNVVVNIFPESTAGNTDMTTWHIDMARWADVILIAPSTINTIAKIAYGFADNALTTLVSASRSPVIIAPAADVDMYQNPLTQDNVSKLESLGFYIISAEEGELASGLSGIGRLAESNKIIDVVELVLTGYKKDLMNEKVLITAGPTYEDIDPVRFIGNRSSGKMGYALAKAAYLRGADVTLISGPSSETAYQEINYVPVRTASEMKKAVVREMKKNQILIMSAAVADFKPVRVSSVKIKKSNRLKEIKISETQDILTSFNRENKIVVGFALETNNELANAKRKLKEKQLDMIVLNSLKDKRSSFEFETNKVMILKRNGKTIKLPLQSKFQIANKILTELI
ncbi:MAG: bifunctional phosphopantothenoylcysteine decarboxylase/phosphopantothenate--cysteine ligase CoaBC [Ignavibacteria bacterium]|nr:bifunctional phosphopantothenoylcysteine decarboxylase/phosphopantothenate--cysteine ligase CoaBC [Ignavibacteria bacterium]